MVIMSYNMELTRWAIPHGIKTSTIRQRSEIKERSIENTKRLHHYYMHRRPEQEHLLDSDLKRLTVIQEPIIEFIEKAPPHVIYIEGFGIDKFMMQAFFIDYYGSKVHEEEQFYMTEWYQPYRQNQKSVLEWYKPMKEYQAYILE